MAKLKYRDSEGNFHVISTSSAGGADIPVVASEQELENLSQSRGGVAVILSDNTIAKESCHPMDLYQVSGADIELAVTGQPLPDECSPMSGIDIDDSIIVEDFQGGVRFVFGSKSNLLAQFFGLEITDEGQVVILQGETSEHLIATVDPSTGVITKFQEEIDAINELLAQVEDLVWVYGWVPGEDGIESSNPIYQEIFRQALPYIVVLKNIILPGVTSFRIKGDADYRHLDSDVIRVLDQSLLRAIDSIKMPVGSTIKVFVDEHTEYDTDWFEFTGAIGEGADADVSNATIIDDIEFTGTTILDQDLAVFVPTITICSEDLTSILQLVWSVSDSSQLEVVAVYNDGNPIYLLHEGVWNEEGITYVKELLNSGCNRLAQVSKGGNQNLYNPETGICTYKDLDGEAAQMLQTYLSITLTCYVSVKANARTFPATIETYERYPDAWKKQEVMASTVKQWTEETMYSELPPSTELVYATFMEFGELLNGKQATLVSGTNIKTINNQSILGSGNIDIQGGSGTVDSALSTSSTNPVQNKVVTEALNNKVSVVSGKGLSTNDYTTSEKNRLAGIETGAQVNVQSDWNATSGDAFIKNKPTFATINGQRIDQGGNIELGGQDEDLDNDTLNDIVAFLEGTNTEQTLAGIIENLQAQIQQKQDTLVNGLNLKTINNQNLLGGGNIDTSLEVEDTIKENSTKPVQSQAIKKYVDDKVEEIVNIGSLATITAVDTTSEVDSLETLLDEISGETIQMINLINGEII